VPFLLAMYTHATGCFVRDTPQPYSPFAGNPFWNHCIGYEGWRWELIGGALYLFERILREVRSRRETEIVKVVRHPYGTYLTTFPGLCHFSIPPVSRLLKDRSMLHLLTNLPDAVEIQFRKPSFRYKAGQWLFLNVPSVSRHQWHPFTITSCPFDPYVSVHVRQVGDFTRALADALGAGQSQAELYDELDPMGMYEVALQHGQTMPRIRIDGPYGAPAEDVFANEIAVLVGTGIGVTPWASILKNVWHLRQAAPDAVRRLRRVEFIWVAKDTSSFEWFQALLASLEQQSFSAAGERSGMDFLRIHTYLTQRVDADTANNIVLNSVGMERDPLTELRSRTNFGRPEFGKLLGAMRDGILDGSYLPALKGTAKTRVGVYLCGPSAAARDIQRACRESSCPEVQFKFWKEHF